MNNLKFPDNSILFIDASHGVAGDMLMAALVDLGVPQASLIGPLSEALPEHRLHFSPETRRGIVGCKAVVETLEKSPPHRHLSDLIGALDHPMIPEPVRQQASEVYRRLAQAEARVHGSTPEQVHFHEVGAIDAQVDILGTLLAIHWLQPTEIIVTPMALGSGVVKAAHGIIPIPAPAVVELLRDVPVCAGPAGRELTTPTGAALLTTLADRYGHAPDGSPVAQGWGAGTRIAPESDPPNLVRAMLLKGGAPGRETIAVLETHLDHLSGEEAGGVVDQLMDSGALDAVLVPAWMKKSRPGQLLTVLARPADRERLVEEIHILTGTLGVRERLQQRSALRRETVQIEVSGVSIRIKKAWLGSRLISQRPEQDDLRSAAAVLEISPAEVRRLAEIEIEKVGHSFE
ncbi:MAG: nickel pincer cofactor biosynthesis protein LarC [Planctomycetota bacterium]|nr:nickel pincer cofactor biosynthesis protein LarC [Planctomycetota bacterium]